MQDAANTGAEETVTTLNYQGSPYEDSSYEIVGTPPVGDDFIPLAINVIHEEGATSDPMFHDFGGSVAGSSDSLWHLPQGVRYAALDTVKSEKQREEEEREAVQAQIEAARAEGFEAGKQAGLLEAQAQIEHNNQLVNTKIGGIIKDMVTQINERLKEIEKDSAKFVLTLTDKIIPHVVEINPEYILPILEEALGLAGSAVIKRIRVSPEDKEFITVVGLEKSLKEFDGTWEFVADETIKAGCVIETSAGEVIYDLDKAWQRVKNNVVKVLR